MKNFGRSLLLASTAVSLAGLVPASLAGAATDVAGSVRTVAERAAEVTAEEQSLLEMAAVPDLDVSERAELEARIEAVDASGVELLTQLDRLDVDLSQATRISLGALAPVADRLRDPDVFVPAGSVYDAATADLLRIAATPDAVTSAPATSGGPAFGLLAVAALSLLALGAAALGNSLRREPDAGELESLTWNDGLTGLANRRKLDADLARHDGAETSAILLDVDHFAEINDTYGRAVGDEVLRQVGDLIAREVRYDDVVYRYDDEEFCVLLPGATAEDAREVAERLVGTVRGIELPDGRHVTVSVGVAGTSGDAAEAVERADRALDAAKEHGRDRAVAGA